MSIQVIAVVSVIGAIYVNSLIALSALRINICEVANYFLMYLIFSQKFDECIYMAKYCLHRDRLL